MPKSLCIGNAQHTLLAILLTVSLVPVIEHTSVAQENTASQETATSTTETSESDVPTFVDEKPSSPEGMDALANFLENAYRDTTPPESIRMLVAIARGSEMGPGEGWFGPGASRYSSEWLAALHGVSLSDGISSDQFRGPLEWFNRLDRNKDGHIEAEDLDWSDGNPYVQQSYMVNRLFRRMDPEGNGRLTRDELLAFFDKVATGKDSITSDDLRDTLLAGVTGSFLPGDAPTPEMLVRGLFAGEIGSLNEGPRVDDPAPDFSLKTQDGSGSVRLSELLGSKPVVLVFGNFTCGPFRAMYPAVDDLCQRYKDDAVFLSVYVREAHPSDGWHMESNTRVGVSVAQPKTYAERVEVAQQCHALLKHSMPLLVDEINDPVGNTYSGMPARLYVIDGQGKVAYKGGRGPFGFKAGEMEQALLLTLLDQKEKKVASTNDPMMSEQQ